MSHELSDLLRDAEELDTGVIDHCVKLALELEAALEASQRAVETRNNWLLEVRAERDRFRAALEKIENESCSFFCTNVAETALRAAPPGEPAK